MALFLAVEVRWWSSGFGIRSVTSSDRRVVTSDIQCVGSSTNCKEITSHYNGME